MKVQTIESTPARPEEIRRAAPASIANVGPLERLLTGLAGGVLLGLASDRKVPAALGFSLAGGGLIARALSGYCPAYQALGIDNAHEHMPAMAVPAQHGFKFDGEVKVHKPPDEVYQFWRKLENLPQLFEHLDQVAAIDERYSRWRAKGPLGTEVEWEAEVFSDKPYEMIAWRSMEGSELDTAGSVHFDRAFGDTGTIVRLSLKYNPPGGKVGAKIAQLLGEDFEAETAAGLQKLKQILESKQVGARNA
jgi:uncharacterized membrane protein